MTDYACVHAPSPPDFRLPLGLAIADFGLSFPISIQYKSLRVLFATADRATMPRPGYLILPLHSLRLTE
jgi:hypothetical protein